MSPFVVNQLARLSPSSRDFAPSTPVAWEATPKVNDSYCSVRTVRSEVSSTSSARTSILDRLLPMIIASTHGWP